MQTSDDAGAIAPGFHRIDDAAYHAMPLCSKHALDVLHEASPAHLLYQRTHPIEPTDAMRFGSAVHARVLEPDAFAGRHPVITTCTGATKDGKPCRNPGKALTDAGWRCGVHAVGLSAATPTGAITLDQLTHIEAMRDAIRDCRPARELLDAPGENEIAGLWDWPVETPDGPHVVRCKMKADAARTRFDAVVDLKTCESAHPNDFARSIASYGYHRQAAFYLDGFARLGRPLAHFIVVAVEKVPPYGVGVYVLRGDDVELGRAQNAKLMQTYARCDRAGVWPKYENEFQDIGLPPGAYRAAMAEV